MIKPKTIWHPSPNFREPIERHISCIVLHATATPGLQSPLDWLTSSESKASAHYLIGTNGDAYHLVLDGNIAWHAGNSRWKGMEHVNPVNNVPTMNNCSIGIELVNANDGKMIYPDAQVKVCADLVKYLCETYNVSLDNVVTHADIAPGRKNDPLGFDMEGFRKLLA